MEEVRKRHENSPEPQNWLTTYADLMSLLLCFFVLLFAFSTLDMARFKDVIMSVKGAFGILEGGLAVFDANQLPVNSGHVQQDYPTDRGLQIAQVASRISALLEEKGIDGRVEIVPDYRRGVVIRFRDAVLFDFAKADIKPESEELLQAIADILRELPYEIMIEGHTDNVPVKPNSEFESNWDLSTRRAVRVLSYLIEEAGVGPPERLSAAGYGEYRPVAANDTEQNRAQNRRVDIVILVPPDTGEQPVPEVQTQAAVEGGQGMDEVILR